MTDNPPRARGGVVRDTPMAASKGSGVTCSAEVEDAGVVMVVPVSTVSMSVTDNPPRALGGVDRVMPSAASNASRHWSVGPEWVAYSPRLLKLTTGAEANAKAVEAIARGREDTRVKKLGL